ncbi:MAG: winged helix DNA-binding protein [Bacteroidota bacterium]
MDKIVLIRQLLDYIEEYNKELFPEQMRIDGFMEWLISKYTTETLSKSEHDIDGRNFELLGAMQQYTNKYIKEALQNSSISTIWDFSFLAILHHQGEKSMVELINIARMEKSSGMEVIRRLQQSKLIESVTDAIDRRRKIQKITPQGKIVLQKLYPKVIELSSTVNGNLSLIEKSNLFYLLNKLNKYHQRNLGFET